MDMAHTANFIKLNVIIAKIFSVRIFCATRLLRPRATAPSSPRPSYATGPRRPLALALKTTGLSLGRENVVLEHIPARSTETA